MPPVILIIDDDTSLRRVLEYNLRNVATTASGKG
jgi:DNA-binding NtrC family response regulator